MTLKNFKDQISKYLAKGMVDISNISGKEDQDYGQLLESIVWWTSEQNTKFPLKGKMTLTNLTADSAGGFSMGITFQDQQDSSDFIQTMKASYEGANKSNFTFSNNIAKWTMPKNVFGTSGGAVDDTTARKEQIKQNIMGKIPIQSLLGGVKTSYTESDEERTNILVEEINRIKTLLNGRI
jgi:hypothetical protein